MFSRMLFSCSHKIFMSVFLYYYDICGISLFLDSWILKNFTYLLGSLVPNDGRFRQEFCVMDIAQPKYSSLSITVLNYKEIFSSIVLPALSYSYETRALNSDMESRMDVIGNGCLLVIMEYRWEDFLSNRRILTI